MARLYRESVGALAALVAAELRTLVRVQNEPAPPTPNSVFALARVIRAIHRLERSVPPAQVGCKGDAAAVLRWEALGRIREVLPPIKRHVGMITDPDLATWHAKGEYLWVQPSQGAKSIALLKAPPLDQSVVRGLEWAAEQFTDEVVRDPAIEARDKWIYEQCLKPVAYKTIIRRLNKERVTWERITSIPGIKKAARAYAKRHGLPPIPPRKRGRPATK